MYIKGADSVVKQKLDMSIPQPFLEFANQQLYSFSIVGLRTLLIGMKVLSKKEVEEFKA